MAVHTYNPNTWEPKAGGLHIGGQHGYIARLPQKKITDSGKHQKWMLNY